MDLGLETEKAHVGTRINNLEIICVPIFKQNKQLWLFWSKFAQKWILVWKFRKLMLEEKLPSSRFHVCQFSGKRDFFNPNLPKNEFWGQKFKILSPDLESALPRCHLGQFSVKMNNFDFFVPNLPKKEIKIWNSEN